MATVDMAGGMIGGPAVSSPLGSSLLAASNSNVTFWALAVPVVICAYLIGGIPWALIVGKRVFGIDPREHGSGNLGATNVLRLFGYRAGAATLFLDFAKGILATALARMLFTPALWGEARAGWVTVAAGVASIVGHSYSPYIRFSGGKGVATSAGVLTVLTPLTVPIQLVVLMAVVGVSRIMSLGSLVIAVAYPLLVLWLYPGDRARMVTALALATLVFWRHRSNIVRLAHGEEAKLDFKRVGKVFRQEAEEEDAKGQGANAQSPCEQGTSRQGASGQDAGE
ncbi:MAG: glycerol-3-phosphate 1-O-acyltransferase PlsY [Coriobacteriia bacterium]|nr:glycerol-3-phosphate 1-O-acyltransferase PlsY [Coriobacteriia bacterium]